MRCGTVTNMRPPGELYYGGYSLHRGRSFCRVGIPWDVIQDEATRELSKSGLPTFGNTFSKWHFNS